ncbi:MAG: hypothetical protein HY706_12640 [Candidatus Hydrogenedentes bacterium]|nr:hypothetical protein [Candidatus Hydrogenedentota bacterium]
MRTARVAAVLGLASFTWAWADELQRPDPGKRIRVFLFAGQSNMEGRADGTKLTEQEKVRLGVAQKRVQLAYNHAPIQPLDVVSPPDDIRRIYQLDRIFGPELFFGITLSEAWPDEKILLIKLAVGATSLYGSWNPDWSEEKAAAIADEEKRKLYDEFAAYIHAVLSGYAPDDYEICAMLWVQGEGDSKVEVAATEYGKNLRNLIARIRKDTGEEKLPFLLFQVGSGKVVDGMRKTAKELEYVTLLPQSLDPQSPDFYTKIPNGHYDHAGMEKIGRRFAEAYLREYGRKP